MIFMAINLWYFKFSLTTQINMIIKDMTIKKENKYNNQTKILKNCKIIRDKHTKSAYLSINISGEWNLYAGDTVETIDIKKPIAQGKDYGTYPLYVLPSKRSYFKLETALGSVIFAETHLPMEGGYNFRDLGGLESKNGKHIKWGKLFRTDDLYNLTNADLTYLSSIPISTIIDFRCKDEYSILPDRIPEQVKNHYYISIEPGRLKAYAKSKQTSKENVIDAMKHLYKLLVTEDEYINAYEKFFTHLQDHEQLPILFHCSAGKDRTGLATALLLYALDIPKETIIEDYLVSNIYLADKYQPLIEENPSNEFLYTVIPEYLENALSEIEKNYGTITNFLVKRINADIDKLREMFLY